MAYTPVPASQTTGSSQLAHLATVFYRKKALSRLQKKFVFQDVCMKDMLERQSGRIVQFYRYNNLTANTTEKTPEGTVGTSIGISSRTVSARVAQYTNFLTISDFLKETAIDPIVQRSAELLGYQAGLSVDTITRNVIDNEASSTNLALTGSFLRVADLRNARHQLQGVDVQPFEGNLFTCYIHPYVSYDLINDPAATGLADIHKYTSPEKAGLISNPDRGELATVASCKVIETTNATQIAGSPNKWRVYIFGADGVGAVDLAGSGPSRRAESRRGCGGRHRNWRRVGRFAG